VLEFASVNTETSIDGKKSQNSSTSDEPLIKRKPVALSNLNKQYTFERFVPGGGNQFAYDSAIEVARTPGKFSPMFIHGDVGLGKTHLLQAIAHRIMETHPQMRVLYTTSEEFMNSLISAIKTNTTEKFREKFRRNVDVLLIDDLQFLIEKKGIQNELFHTFNTLHDAGKQIAFCSDRSPAELESFHSRLISRFQMGLVVETMAPDVETRKRIIKKIADLESLEITDEVVNYLAENVSTNIREIYGYLIKLIMATKLQGKNMDLLTIKMILSEICPTHSLRKTKTLSPKERLFTAVEKSTGIKETALISKTRKKPVSEIRMLAMYVAVTEMKEQVTSVALWFGKTHSTVNYSINKIKEQLKKGNARISDLIDSITVALANTRAENKQAHA
jgi:chromosomal replication initiator protein